MHSPYELIRKNIEKHVRLSNEEFNYFVEFTVAKNILKKKLLLKEGEICNYTAFVNSGCLRTYTRDKDGNEHVIQFAIEDYWAGDLYSFLTGNPSTYNIEATQDSNVLLIQNNAMEKVFEKVPKFERFFRILVQRSYIALQQRMSLSQSSSAQEKYENLIKKFPDLELRVAQKHIASYLGITAESLSRIKRKSYHK